MFQQFDMMVQNFWAALQAQPDILPHLWLYVSLSLLVMLEGPVSILVAAGAAASGYLNPVPVMVKAGLPAVGAWLGMIGVVMVTSVARMPSDAVMTKVAVVAPVLSAASLRAWSVGVKAHDPS